MTKPRKIDRFKIEEMASYFSISDSDKRIFEKWAEKHPCDKVVKKEKRRLFEYVFVPTGVGTMFFIRCDACGAELNLTDITNW